MAKRKSQTRRRNKKAGGKQGPDESSNIKTVSESEPEEEPYLREERWIAKARAQEAAAAAAASQKVDDIRRILTKYNEDTASNIYSDFKGINLQNLDLQDLVKFETIIHKVSSNFKTIEDSDTRENFKQLMKKANITIEDAYFSNTGGRKRTKRRQNKGGKKSKKRKTNKRRKFSKKLK